MSPAELAKIAARDPELRALLAEQRRRESVSTLLGFSVAALREKGEAPARHHRLIISKLQAISEGTIDRLMIFAPPGSAKSTYATKIFPAWWFVPHPKSCVISASHTGDLATSFGREVRGIVADQSALLGYSLSEDGRAADNWLTDGGGVYRAVGVGQAIAGRRADLAVIDDPVKSREAAESKVERDKVWDWYRGDLYNRLRPGARILLIMTRWHDDDLGGRLLERMRDGSGDEWTILRLPALAEDPSRSTVERPIPKDPLGRKPGEALWPEWEDEAALNRKRRVVGEREWSAQYQQSPRPDDGVLFQPGKVTIVTMQAPQEETLSVVRAWDLAATEQTGTNDPDWTVGTRLALLKNGRVQVQDVVRMRGTPGDVEAAIRHTAEHDGRDVIVGIPKDPAQAGKWQVAYLTSRLAGFIVRQLAPTGSKATRAMPFASQMEAGNVECLRAPWTRDFFEELSGFPSATKDDQVDSVALAYEMVAESQASLGVMHALQQRLDDVRIAQTTGQGARPALATKNGELVEHYRQIFAGATQRKPTNCRACGQPVGSSRVDDGADNVWHMECA